MRLVEGIATVDDLEDFLAALDDVAEEHGVSVQAFDARYVVSREHLQRAVDLADRAIDRGENVARDRSVEILLYAAGRRQIDRALEMGVGVGELRTVVLVDAGTDGSGDEAAAAAAARDLIDPADTLGDYDEARVRAFFDVSGAELDAVAGDLADVVLERVALLDVEK